MFFVICCVYGVTQSYHLTLVPIVWIRLAPAFLNTNIQLLSISRGEVSVSHNLKYGYCPHSELRTCA